MDQRSFWTE